VTAPSKAAAAQLTIPAAAMKVGVLAGTVGVATTKTALLSVAAASAITAGAVVATSAPGFTARPASTVRVTSPFRIGNNARPAYWFYFPGGPEGPVMLRATSGANASNPDRRVLQNANGNYTYEGRTVSINNYRMWMSDLSVFALPTDGNELRAFLTRMQGKALDMQPVQAKGRGLFVVAERTAEGEASEPWAMRYSNVLNEDYFQSDWRSDATIVDNRDAMHTRGWTYFQVSGQVSGRNVTGVGCIPFIYATSRSHGPWLKLRIGANLTLVDVDTGAYVTDARNVVLSKCASGSFFKGLSRPWMGLHAMDTVRRDAAARQMPFQTVLAPDGRTVQVTVIQGQTRLVYAIDMDADVVKSISFFTGQAPVGQLDFEYLQDLPQVRSNFIAPRIASYRGSLSEDAGMLWLTRLVDGTWARWMQ
jgi:hypothetical protein